MPDRPTLEHVIRRSSLPWRPLEDHLTECGKLATQYPSITYEAFTSKVRTQGQLRSSLSTCMTCWNTADRYQPWAIDPIDALRREILGMRGDTDTLRRENARDRRPHPSPPRRVHRLPRRPTAHRRPHRPPPRQTPLRALAPGTTQPVGQPLQRGRQPARHIHTLANAPNHRLIIGLILRVRVIVPGRRTARILLSHHNSLPTTRSRAVNPLTHTGRNSRLE